MNNHIQSYYRGERVSNLGFIGFGFASIILGLVYYYFSKSQLSFGFFSCSILLGAIQIFLGLIRFFRTFNQYKKANNSTSKDLDYLKDEEHKSLSAKVDKFKTKRMLVTSAFILSMILFSILSLMGFDKFILGTLGALTLQSGVMLVFDLFSQYRAQEYLHQLSKLDEAYQSPLV